MIVLAWVLFFACILGTFPVLAMLGIGMACFFLMGRRILTYLCMLLLLIGMSADMFIIPWLQGRVW